MAGIETLPVLPLAAFRFAGMSWGVRTDQLVLDARLSGGFLKKGQEALLAVGKTIGKLEAVAGLVGV